MQNFFIAKHLYSRYRTCACETDRCRQVRAQSPHYNAVPRIIHNNSSSIGKLQRFHTSQGTNIHKFLPIRVFGYAQGRLHTATTFNNYIYIKLAALTSRKKEFVSDKIGQDCIQIIQFILILKSHKENPKLPSSTHYSL